MKKAMPPVLLSLLCVAAGFGLLRYSPAVSLAVREGLSVCAGVVIPSLFPFMVLSAFVAGSSAVRYLSLPLLPLMHLLRLPRFLGATVLMSFIGGYPVGARLISLHLEKGRITPQTAARMLTFCCNAGPAFILSAVGAKLLHSTGAGVILLLSHVLGSVLIGLFGARGQRTQPDSPADLQQEPAAAAFVSAVRLSSSSMLVMCAFIVLFYALTALLTESGVFFHASGLLGFFLPMTGEAFRTALLTGLLEVTSGCILSVEAVGQGPFILIAFLLSFSGLSVIGQVMSCFSGQEIRFRPFLISRVVHGLLTVLISYPLLRLFCRVLPGSTEMPPSMAVQPNTPLITLCLIAMCCLLAVSAEKPGKKIKKA